MKEKLWENKELIIAIILVMCLLIGGSFALFKITLAGQSTNIIKSGSLELVLDDTAANGISLTNTIPMSDASGLTTEAYTFTIENKSSQQADYSIYLDDVDLSDGEVRMDDKYVKYSLTKNDGEATTALLTTTGTNPNRVLDSGTIAGSTTNSYTLRVWIDKDADNAVMGTIFLAKIRIEATQS